MTARACFPEPPFDCSTVTVWPGLGAPKLDELRVEIVVEFARRIEGDVQNRERAGGLGPSGDPEAEEDGDRRHDSEDFSGPVHGRGGLLRGSKVAGSKGNFSQALKPTISDFSQLQVHD